MPSGSSRRTTARICSSSALQTRLQPADLDDASTGEGDVERRVFGPRDPVEVAVRGPAAQSAGVEQTLPVHAVARHESAGEPDRKAPLRVERIELHVGQHEVEMVTDAGGVLVAVGRNASTACQLLFEAEI